MVNAIPPPHYEETTDGVRIRVLPKFMHDESNPSRDHFMWAYTVEIQNETDKTWTLVGRHWRMVDSQGRTQAVDGEGVIGQTPTLGPGQHFRYTSGAPLTAPSGMMSGSYDLIDEHGQEMCAVIPVFSLDSPYETSRPS